MVGFVCFIQQKRERLSNFMTTSLLIKMKGKIISPFQRPVGTSMGGRFWPKAQYKM